MASTPLRGPRSFLVIRRLAFHPVLEGRVDVECLEDAQARIGGAPQKAIVLGKRERFGTKQDALHLGVLGCPQDSVGVREQLSRRLAAQLDGCVGETRVAVEAPVTREGHDACDTGLVDGVVGLPGRLALHHDQGGRPFMERPSSPSAEPDTWSSPCSCIFEAISRAILSRRYTTSTP